MPLDEFFAPFYALQAQFLIKLFKNDLFALTLDGQLGHEIEARAGAGEMGAGRRGGLGDRGRGGPCQEEPMRSDPVSAARAARARTPRIGLIVPFYCCETEALRSVHR